MTSFENLSNEIIYEIFDFLDFVQVYNAFSNLNLRFEQLLNHPSFPIKINLLLTSRSTFEHHDKQILLSNRHRITYLRLSNSLVYDLIFSPISILAEFTQLENLVFHEISRGNLEKLLPYFHALPCLSTLVINCADHIRYDDGILCEILRFPALKFCKLSSYYHVVTKLQTVTSDKISSIEHLIIQDGMEPFTLNNLLSLTPKLRRLSFSLSPLHPVTPIEVYTNQLNYLTNISLAITQIDFDEFELLMKNLFGNAEVLIITILDSLNDKYFEENRWKQLILYHLPNLRVFDIRFYASFYSEDRLAQLLSMTDKFKSSFWLERQWFFEKQLCKETDQYGCLLFYSINPYRRRRYGVGGEILEEACLSDVQCNMNSVQSLSIADEQWAIERKKYFPNVTNLSVTYDANNEYSNYFVNELNNIVPLIHITKLDLSLALSHFSKFIELLRYTSNVHSLTIDLNRMNDKDLIPIQKSEGFELLSTTNKIKSLTIRWGCTWKMTKFWIKLCHQLECLTMNSLYTNYKPILRYLLSKNRKNARHLFLLTLQIHQWERTSLDAFISSEKFTDISVLTIKNGLLGCAAHLWW